MTVDINSLSLEISKTLSEEVLAKSLPPKLAYRFRSWMKESEPRFAKNPQLYSEAQKLIQQKFEELAIQKALKKNEAVASFYNNGVVRMDFGSEIPEKIKKAAMNWAKKRGLKAVEASVQKSMSNPSYIIFSKSQQSSVGECTNRYKWEMDTVK